MTNRELIVAYVLAETQEEQTRIGNILEHKDMWTS